VRVRDVPGELLQEKVLGEDGLARLVEKGLGVLLVASRSGEELGDVEDRQPQARQLVPVLLEVLLHEERVHHLPDERRREILGLELVEARLRLARDLLGELDRHPRLLHKGLEDLVSVELLHRLARRPDVELPALDERLLLYLAGEVEDEPPKVRNRVFALLPVELDEELAAELWTDVPQSKRLAWFMLLKDEGILELDHDGPPNPTAWGSIQARLNVADAVVIYVARRLNAIA